MLYGASTRKDAFSQLDRNWDLIIIGGGITGAGILREATRAGLNAVLFEQNDFSSGTSSRSSKLVHGGLRYLSNFQFHLTYQSVIEREKLLEEGEGLVEKLPFIYPIFRSEKMPAWMTEIGLSIYDLMGRKWRGHQRLNQVEMRTANPFLNQEEISTAYRFCDAQTDDSRLVLRVIQEAIASGGSFIGGKALAINYTKVVGLLFSEDETVRGVNIFDKESGNQFTVIAKVVINATGAWVDAVRQMVGGEKKIRPLRGSHLIFTSERFPLEQAVSFNHPEDRRPVFAFPWEGVTLLGTTDLDHLADLADEPRISREEVTYLLEAVGAHFPSLQLTADDVITTFAGVRPVISQSSELDPSKESREHALWDEKGLITVTGGKLTTFRQIAIDCLHFIRHHFPGIKLSRRMSALDRQSFSGIPSEGFDRPAMKRLIGRYGSQICAFLNECNENEKALIPGTKTHLLELRWATRNEAVCHLDDLMLRRTRLGLLLSDGGISMLHQIREIVQSELSWNDERWLLETNKYVDIWEHCYSSPAKILGEPITGSA